MRIRVFGAAAIWLAAVPAWAQVPKDVQGPWTLTPEMVMCTDLPIAARHIPRLTIKGIHDLEERLATTTGLVVIGRSPDDGLAVGQRYTAARVRNEPGGFPREGYGDLRVSGIITVTAIDDINAMAQIDAVCDTIEPGDLLEPFAAAPLPATAADLSIAPDFTERANVLFGTDHRGAFGLGDVFSIDRGTLHGVVPGARYAVYRDQRNGLPLIYSGELVVMTTAEMTSKVIATKALTLIEAGDAVVPRRKP